MEYADIETLVGNAGERYKIICVDDSQSSLMMLKRRLMAYYEVYPAESSEKLFKILEKITPDLILLDINMPDVDGYQILKSLNDDERYADIPVIFLTGTSKKDNVINGIKLGAVDYVIKPYEKEALVACIDKHISASRAAKSSPKEDENKPQILAVDDIVSILKTVKSFLCDKYKVYTISNAERVLDFLKIKKIDLILMDYLMPCFNGFELLTMIRELPDYKDTPIIMLTTEGTVSQIKEAIALGASGFIVKPFKKEELLEKIENHINLKKSK